MPASRIQLGTSTKSAHADISRPPRPEAHADRFHILRIVIDDGTVRLAQRPEPGVGRSRVRQIIDPLAIQRRPSLLVMGSQSFPCASVYQFSQLSLDLRTAWPPSVVRMLIVLGTRVQHQTRRHRSRLTQVRAIVVALPRVGR